MSVSAVSRKQIFAASGTGPYTFNFRVKSAADIIVQKRDGTTVTTLTEGAGASQYSIVLTNGGANGGVVTLNTALTTETLLIQGDTPLTQPIPYANLGAFFPERHETSYDRLTYMVQELSAKFDQAIKIPAIDSTGTTVELPVASARAGLFLGFDVDGNVTVSATIDTVVSAYMAIILDVADEAAFKAATNLEIGTDVQAYNANLTTWAGKTAPSGTVVGTTDTQTLTNKTITAANIKTFTVTLADDTATSFTVANYGGEGRGIILIKSSTENACAGIAWYNVLGGSMASFFAQADLNIVTGGGALTGTTSTDAKFSVSAANDGKIYLENRRGGSETFEVTIF